MTKNLVKLFFVVSVLVLGLVGIRHYKITEPMDTILVMALGSASVVILVGPKKLIQ